MGPRQIEWNELIFLALVDFGGFSGVFDFWKTLEKFRWLWKKFRWLWKTLGKLRRALNWIECYWTFVKYINEVKTALFRCAILFSTVQQQLTETTESTMTVETQQNHNRLQCRSALPSNASSGQMKSHSSQRDEHSKRFADNTVQLCNVSLMENRLASRYGTAKLWLNLFPFRVILPQLTATFVIWTVSYVMTACVNKLSATWTCTECVWWTIFWAWATGWAYWVKVTCFAPYGCWKALEQYFAIDECSFGTFSV